MNKFLLAMIALLFALTVPVAYAEDSDEAAAATDDSSSQTLPPLADPVPTDESSSDSSQ